MLRGKITRQSRQRRAPGAPPGPAVNHDQNGFSVCQGPPGQHGVKALVLAAEAGAGTGLPGLRGVDAAPPAHLGSARGLAFYQLASATVDWVMWIVLAVQGVFSTTTGRVLVIASIPTHYLLGLGRW
jgi:hypothetical protein